MFIDYYNICIYLCKCWTIYFLCVINKIYKNIRMVPILDSDLMVSLKNSAYNICFYLCKYWIIYFLYVISNTHKTITSDTHIIQNTYYTVYYRINQIWYLDAALPIKDHLHSLDHDPVAAAWPINCGESWVRVKWTASKKLFE